MNLPPMKISDRLRHGAKGAFFVVGGDADNMLEAADLLEECERTIALLEAVLVDVDAEALTLDIAAATLARLRAQERG